ncbi:MAG TPA: M23 family metallopeptidase [Bryobacteraceae bacterium]|nr:M23 family metallopeptidase [Bryobacteraceae bacterium]
MQRASRSLAILKGMRWSMLFLAVSAWGQIFSVTPPAARQGETLKVTGDKSVHSARMHGRTIPLFPQEDGHTLGLMPVPVLEKPGAYTLEFLDEKGAVLHAEPVTVKDARYPRQNIVIAPDIAGLKPSPGEQETVGAFRKTVSSARYWQEPLRAPESGCLTSLFGVMRLHNGKPTGDFHAGVDQRGAAGAPIHPVAAGVVKIVKPYNLRGGTVAVDHGQGMQSIYLHMSGFAVKEGDHVTPESVIGYIGSTGRSTGPHVHWTLYVNGEAVDPGQWMTLKACPPAAKKPVRAKARAQKSA